MSKHKLKEETVQEILETIDGAREMLQYGNVDMALEGLGILEKGLTKLRHDGVPIDQELQGKVDALSRDIAAAQQRADDGGGGAPVEANDGDDGGGVDPEPAQPAALYGACQQNATDQQGYVALAGDEDEGEKGGPCDNCVIL
jgi:hypothetical protein